MGKEDKKKFTVVLEINNIGPHYGDNAIDFSSNVDSNKLIFLRLMEQESLLLAELFAYLNQKKTIL